jgi:hypothetical protein
MRTLVVLAILSSMVLGGCCSGPSADAVRTATTSIVTQANVAKAAIVTCGAEAEQRKDACDLATKSLDDIIATSSALNAPIKP